MKKLALLIMIMCFALHGKATNYADYIWCGTVDSELTVKSYIVPGLGDAGDLAYGDKM